MYKSGFIGMEQKTVPVVAEEFEPTVVIASHVDGDYNILSDRIYFLQPQPQDALGLETDH